VEFSPQQPEEVLHEDVTFFRQANNCHSQASRGWQLGSRTLPGIWHQFRHVLQYKTQNKGELGLIWFVGIQTWHAFLAEIYDWQQLNIEQPIYRHFKYEISVSCWR
jgi:hypothetical protein